VPRRARGEALSRPVFPGVFRMMVNGAHSVCKSQETSASSKGFR